MPKHDLSKRRVAILAADGFEQAELTEPLKALKETGATVHVIAPWSDAIRHRARRQADFPCSPPGGLPVRLAARRYNAPDSLGARRPPVCRR